MTTFFLYSVRTACTECGESIALEGPALEIVCGACQSKLELSGGHWKGVLSFRADAEERKLVEGLTRGSSLSDGEIKLLVKWGPQRPLCANCNALLDLTAAPPGTDGILECPQCAKTMTTFPPPLWLAAVEPDAMQLFGAARPAEAAGAGAGVEVPREDRPVSFACPDCGANLKITAASARVFSCHFCQTDLYLPDPLWRALHPVKKRTPWYVAFKR